MRIWIDTEFNGFGGKLLSIALVAEDQSYLYEVLPAAMEECVEWVQENVLPQIKADPEGGEIEFYTPLITVKHKISEFLCKYDHVEIIADWPDDIRYLMELLIVGPGLAVSTPTIMNLTIDRSLNGLSMLPHHAYFDAVGNMMQQLNNEYGTKPYV